MKDPSPGRHPRITVVDPDGAAGPKRWRINVVEAGRLAAEHIRASLRGGPFVAVCSDRALCSDETDLYVVPAAEGARAVEAAGGVPVIAFGPPRLLRASFLAGCVDYLREPLDPVELAVRAQAALDRSARRYSVGGVTLELDGLALTGSIGSTRLTPREGRLLRLLLQRPGQPVSRDALCVLGWGKLLPRRSRALDAHISQLRRKLRAVFGPDASFAIRAARREGYLLLPPRGA